MALIPRHFTYLERSLLDNDYFPRKTPNQLCLVINLNSRLIYPVPVAIEHIDYAGMILGTDVKTYPESASKLIPSNIILNHDRANVDEIITGVSGMESGFGVRHSLKSLNEAHMYALNFVRYGEFDSENLKEKIISRYAL